MFSRKLNFILCVRTRSTSEKQYTVYIRARGERGELRVHSMYREKSGAKLYYPRDHHRPRCVSTVVSTVRTRISHFKNSSEMVLGFFPFFPLLVFIKRF